MQWELLMLIFVSRCHTREGRLRDFGNYSTKICDNNF